MVRVKVDEINYLMDGHGGGCVALHGLKVSRKKYDGARDTGGNANLFTYLLYV